MGNILSYQTFKENINAKQYLIIVDVQVSFKRFFTEMYIHKLKEYAEQFQNVYQIWDNHTDGADKDKSYLYDINQPGEVPLDDLYEFVNQKSLIEKRYKYDVDIEHFKNIIDNWKELKDKKYQKGNVIWTKYGTPLVYIGNNHQWFHVPKKMYRLFESLKGQNVYIVGGADSECLEDIITAAISFGVNIKPNHSFIYSATHCPIKN